MQRRNFIMASAVAGVALSTLSLNSCTPAAEKKDEATDTKAKDDFVLNEVTIDILQQKMQSKEYTSHAITQLYLTRINDIDKNGPRLNAVIELNPNALDMAADLDKERDNGKVRGPLHGIPVLIKDNINTKDKVATTAGSLALADNFAAKDAFIINKLREAGATILKPLNLSEWANFRSTRSCGGWSAGQPTAMRPFSTVTPAAQAPATGAAVA